MKEIYEAAPLEPLVLEKVEKNFSIKEINPEDKTLIVEPRYGDKTSFDTLYKELSPQNLYPLYRTEKKQNVLRIVKKQGKKRGIAPLMHLALIILTIFTVTLAGYLWWAGGNLKNSVLFAAGLMGILGGHELGHALVARKNSVEATLPFFLPVPPLFAFGTLGAVIFINSPIPDRRSLFDIGIAGPITGFILSLPVLVIGILFSSFVPFDPAHVEIPFLLGTPILFNLLAEAILGDPGSGFILLAHPLAIAGWAGLFVTTLNLLPMGQLDGGHVIRALFPRNFKRIYRWIFLSLILMGGAGFFAQISQLEWLSGLSWPGWIVWAFLAYFITKLEHPGPLNDVTRLDGKRKASSIAMLLIFVVSFTPVPVIPL